MAWVFLAALLFTSDLLRMKAPSKKTAKKCQSLVSYWEENLERNDWVLAFGRLDFLIAPKNSDDEKPFCELENHVEERKEEKRSNDFRGKGHIEDGRTELNILKSGLHADGAAAPVGERNPALQ